MAPRVLVVEGKIAAGKSTLVKILQQRLAPFYRKIVIVPEPVELWESTGALAAFYKDIKGKSYEFQTFVFISRIKVVREAFEKDPDADLYIIERSPYTDYHIFAAMLHKSGHLEDYQMVMYDIWWNMWMRLWPFMITHVLHLDPGVAKCQERNRIRNRTGEDAVDSDYQTKLGAQHDIFFATQCPHPVHTLKSQVNYCTDMDEQDRIVVGIKEFLTRPYTKI